MYIINGIYGGCTDIVNAVIDSSDIDLFSQGMYIHFTDEREVLNGPADPKSGDDFYQIVKNLENDFKSIQTTLEIRHIEPRVTRKTSEFNYIFVDPTNEKCMSWINTRMQVLLEDFVMSDLQTVKSSSVISRYYADLIIPLEDVLEGRLIEKLEPFVDCSLDTRLYESWLTLINYDFPFK